MICIDVIPISCGTAPQNDLIQSEYVCISGYKFHWNNQMLSTSMNTLPDMSCVDVVQDVCGITLQGWGSLSQFPPFRYFLIFLALSEHTLAIEYHVYIWQVSPQLSCGGTCQIYKWFKESKGYFCQIKNFACGEINERSFSNPHPRTIGHTVSR